MRKKLKSTKAETLLETLVSLLIASLSVTLLATAVTASTNINLATRAADEAFAEELAEAELGEVKDKDMTITLKFADGERDVDVVVYGTGAFASYEKEDTP